MNQPPLMAALRGKGPGSDENSFMAESRIEELMKTAARSASFNNFIEAVRNDIGLGRAEKAVSYEFGTLQEFYHWVTENVNIDETADQVSIKGKIPEKSRDRASLLLQAKIMNLSAACDELREQLARALTELQELTKTIIPFLSDLYTAKIGPLELELFALHHRNLWKKRKLELSQKALTEGGSPDLDHMETMLDQEFREWKLQKEELQEKIPKAHNRLPTLMNDAETDEFRELFRLLVRKLHPDINPCQNDKQRMLWFSLQGAYEKGDIRKLNEVATTLGHAGSLPFLPECSTSEAWEKAKGELEKKIAALNAEIRQIKTAYPYTLRDQLQNDRWIEEKLTQLRLMIKKEEAQARLLEE
jgi:hypothetical protein